jgi:hypothetical protein
MAAQNLTFFDDIQTQLDTESERREVGLEKAETI